MTFTLRIICSNGHRLGCLFEKIHSFFKPGIWLCQFYGTQLIKSYISHLESFIALIRSNISRSFPHTTLWFSKIKHQRLKTNLQCLLSHVHILIFSKSNLILQVFGLLSRSVCPLITKISSSEESANTTSTQRVRNVGKLVILFHSSPENITKRCRSPSWKPA